MLFFTLIGAQLVVLSHVPHVGTRLNVSDLPSVLLPFTALAGIITIINMPMRDPMLPNDDISSVYDKPIMNLRTPEDNLTLWQYMTVAWMAPLIQEGYKKQLDNEDIWDLPYTFKHALLHRTFRTLPGSVTRRLLIANGMDLIRTMSITLVRLLSCKHGNIFTINLLTSISFIYARPASTTTCLDARWKACPCDYHLCSLDSRSPLVISTARRVQLMVPTTIL